MEEADPHFSALRRGEPYYDGKSVAEIAALRGVAPTTVEGLLRRSRSGR